MNDTNPRIGVLATEARLMAYLGRSVDIDP